MSYGNLISAATPAVLFNRLLDVLTCRTALIIYACILLVLILVLAIRVIVAEQRRAAALKEKNEAVPEIQKDEALESVKKDIDQKMDKLSGDMSFVKKSLAMGAPYAAGYTYRSCTPDIDKPEANGNAEEEINEGGSRFYMLTQIDKEYESYVRPEYDDNISLKELCEEFRNFSAGQLKLYYDIEDIRRFIGALAVTKLIILQGMSGTGKTSLAYAFGEFLKNKTVVVPIQPMWKERTDLLGYFNEFTRRFNETTLLYKMYEANNNEEIYITVLDEMNIARVEYYFAEFLSLLEIPNPDGRNLDV
ncbi:MAG: AAA family ATPase, partial [Clostridiales bacterium]|nr:AAA family ATPase [Clostridiales bacterium]